MQNPRTLIPNAITVGAMTCGVIAIALALAGQPLEATWWILYATLLDRLDGAAARALKASSPFGAQLDSFSDFVAFGLAPAFVLLGATADDAHALVAVPMLIYIVGCSVRLCRYNLGGGKGQYEGVPSTVAGGVWAALINVALQYDLAPLNPIVFGLVMAVFGISMNLPGLRYDRVGAGPTRFQRWFVPLLALICAVLILTRWLPELLLAITTFVIIAGPIASIRQRKKAAADPEASP